MASSTSTIVSDTEFQERLAAGIVARLSASATAGKQSGKTKPVGGGKKDAASLKHVAALKGLKISDRELMKHVYAVVRDSFGGPYGVVISSRIDPAAISLLEPLNEIVAGKRAEISERNVELLVEAMLPANDPLAAVRSKIETDNARARVQFIEKVRCLTSEELAALAGHGARNKSVTGSRWKAASKVFSVQISGRELYPAFQFRDGKPDPAVAAVLAALPAHMTPWQIAFWFVSSNPWLDGAAPSARLREPAGVVEAARRLAETPAG